MGYVGNQQAEGFVQRPTKQDLTGATGTSLTLSHAVSKEEDIDLYINNVKQEPTTAYTVADTAVTLTGSVVATDDIYVVYNSLALQTVTPPDGSISTAKLASGAVTDAKIDTMAASKLTGALPAIDGSALTGLGAIGVGQTWQDVSASRAKTTEYQNTTSLPIMVSIIFNSSFTDTGQLQVSTTSGSGFITVSEADGGDYYSATGYTTHTANVQAIIPVNHYYKIVQNGSVLNITGWAELR